MQFRSHLPFAAALGALFLILPFAACSSDPETPENEIHHHHHEEPVKATVRLIPGTLSAENPFTESPFERYFTPSPTLPTRSVTWEVSENTGWQRTSGSTALEVVSTQSQPEIVYLMKIEYFDDHGHQMNQEFFEEGQDKIHQHFFSRFEGTTRVADVAALGFDYRYADVAPSGEMLGIANPIGLTGFIRFTGAPSSFDLAIQLMHSPQSKYLSDGKIAPFHLPTPSQLQVAEWDVSLKLPLTVR